MTTTDKLQRLTELSELRDKAYRRYLLWRGRCETGWCYIPQEELKATKAIKWRVYQRLTESLIAGIESLNSQVAV
jgi:hypothetical protein